MILKRTLYLMGFALLAILAPLAYQVDRAAKSLPALDGEARLPGLSLPAAVSFDALAIPSVDAGSRADAYRILGWLHARDRLFQMDLMRRKSSGRLAEIFGEKALPVDLRQRVYCFERVAGAAVEALPADQRQVLTAYTEGVNAWIQSTGEFPPEFRLLGYRPKPWRAEDSLLVALGMFQTLTDSENSERMLTAMDRLLPPEVTAFLTPDTDDYTHPLLGGGESRRPSRPVPAEAIAHLIGETAGQPLRLGSVQSEPMSIGSNNWAVNGTKTADGRAIVADDMHLPLNVPNIWYRVRLRYPGSDLTGVTLPGTPAVVVGSNGSVAWGFTNVDGDFLDLVRLEPNPDDPGEYRTPQGWRRYDTRTETIAVKDGKPATIELKDTIWGPVAPEPLDGAPAALRWIALDPGAVNLGLMEMDGAHSLEKAMDVLNRAGSPPQNAVLADARGRIAWTYMGYLPRRKGFDGSVSRSWANGRIGWNGFIPPEKLPRVIEPPEGFLATANNRTLGKAYPYVIGHGFANGYRAYRIRQQIEAKETLTEKDLQAMQLDTTSEFYEFYRQLGRSLLEGKAGTDPALAGVAEALRAWNGRMDPDSLGISLLVRWRKNLAQSVFAPLVSRCVAADPGFTYLWGKMETPLRALLNERIPATLPDRRYPDWESFLLARLRETVAELRREHGDIPLETLTWEETEQVQIRHPFSRSVPAASWLLDMPALAGACNSFCLKVLHGSHGAGERMAVSPNHPRDGLLHMPGGQSGHPLSSHYRDQEPAWSEGWPTPFLPGKPEHRMSLVPGSGVATR